MPKLEKVQDKFNGNGLPDHDLELKSLWAADSKRDWRIYSRDIARNNWDFRAEARSK